MTKFSSYENEVRPAVVMTNISFFLFAGGEPSVTGYGTQILPPCLTKTRTTTSVNDNPCGEFAAPGLTSSSNCEN